MNGGVTVVTTGDGVCPKGTGLFYWISELGENVKDMTGKGTNSVQNVIVSYDSEGILRNLSSELIDAGYQIVATASGHHDTLRATVTLKPQAVLVTVNQNLAGTLETIHGVIALGTTAVVLVLKDWNPVLANQATDAGVSGFIVEPFRAPHIHATLESAWHHFQKLVGLKDDLEVRKLLERAKGILMKQQFITEEEAHQMILRMSQDHSLPLRDVCDSIVRLKSVLRGDQLKKQ